MTAHEPDLDGAVRALRALGEGDADVGGTRARVIATLARRRKKSRVITVAGVIAAITLSGSAALGWRAGWIPAAWRAIRDLPEMPIDTTIAVDGETTAPRLDRAHARAGRRSPPAPAAADTMLPMIVDAPAAAVLPGPPAASALGSAVPETPRPEVNASKRGVAMTRPALTDTITGPITDTPAAIPPDSAGDPPALDAELADYRVAHALHFERRDMAAALAAWDHYLARWPRGRLAIEARYNRALALIRLHRLTEAAHALRPFSEDARGGYRREEARRLLHALDSARNAP